MNKILTYAMTISLILIGLNSTMAQLSDSKKSDETASGFNIVKVNLTALPISNFSFQYERAVAKKISAAIGVRFMPEGGLPLKSAIKGLIDDDEAWKHFENLDIGNFAITPEVRFYTGKSAFKGFYVAPFARYASYTAKMPFEFEFDHPVDGPQTELIPLDGKISTFTGGVSIGAQWKLSKLIYLDWWILGPHYGSSKGDISGKKNLSTQEEQDALREELSNLEDVSFVEGYEVNSSGAKVNIDGPWGGLRGAVALGFRF